MRHSVVGILALSCLWPATGSTQSTEAAQYAYCQVEDSGNREIWVSQIFPAPPYTGLLATDLASEFHAHVATLGGAGNKQCLVTSRQAAEETRAKIAGIMGKRVFGMRVYKWHDVQWVPSAATYARTAPAPSAPADKYVYCRTTDADTRKMVTTAVFVATLPPADDAERHATLNRYEQAFAQSATALHGVAPGANCIASDSRAEADKSLDDYRHAFPFSGIKKIEMAWRPDPSLASPPVAAVPQAPASPSPASAASAATPAEGNDDVEAEFWRRISSSAQAADFEEYLAAFPQGRHAPIARLEARRLRGGAVAKVPAAGAGANTAAAPAHPLDGTPAGRVATEKFFQIPAGTGASGERSGSRTTGGVRLATTTRTQRISAGNVCQMRSDVRADGAGQVSTVFEAQTWAGLLPLDSTLKSQSAFGNSDFTVHTTAIDALQGQPFPLKEGNTFGYTFAQATNMPGGRRIDSRITQQCTVGATLPASTTIAGLAGEQTELKCRLTFDDPVLKPQDQVLHWYSAIGCFIPDPGR